MKRSTILLALPAVLAPACTNFHTVEEGRTYRSAQPVAGDMRGWVEEHGIRTIVQLRGARPGPELAEVLEEADVAVVRIPISARAYPTREQLIAMWDAFAGAEYPVLIHCRAGADRTGLAAAIYVLQRTGDLERAKAQLAIDYGHTGWGTSCLDHVLEMYSRWHGRMDFRRWAETLYWAPATRLVN